jgi:hypothetical protein
MEEKSAIRTRIDELKMKKAIAEDKLKMWDSLSLAEKLGERRVSQLKTIQKETFDNMIKREYKSLMPKRDILFEEFFDLLLNGKIDNMINFMIKKTK